MSKLRQIMKMVSLALLTLLGFSSARAAVTWTADPADGTLFVGEFPGFTITFNDEVTINKTTGNSFYVMDFISWGDNYTVDNGTLEVKAEGNKLIVSLPYPMVNYTANSVQVPVGVASGVLNVGGEKFNQSISLDYWLIGDVLGFPEKEGIVSDPAWGAGGRATSLKEITLAFTDSKYGDLKVAGENTKLVDSKNYIYDTDFDILAKRIKLYITTTAQGPYYDGMEDATEVAVSKVEGIGRIGTTKYYRQLKITLPETYTEEGKFYNLFIMDGTLVVRDFDNDEEDTSNNESVCLTYTVAPVATVPAQYQTVKYSDWKGLVIKGDNVSVTDASKIGLYAGSALDADGYNNYIKDKEPLATGIIESQSSNEVVVRFNYDPYDGPYTFVIPSGVVKGLKANLTKPVSVTLIPFSITDHAITIDQIPVKVEPANDSSLESIESVRISWGDYNTLSKDSKFADIPGLDDEDNWVPTAVEGKLSINGAAAETVEFVINREQVNDDADPGEGGEVGGIAGMYNYYLEYKPSAPLTASGKYAFTLPANSVYVYVTMDNGPANAEVNVNYNVVAPVSLPEPEINVNATYWDGGGYFDAIDLIWWKAANLPYGPVKIVDPSGIKVVKNMMEDLNILGITTTEFQETENSPNYEDVRLVITLSDFEFDMGSIYEITIPAGALTIMVDGTPVPNPEIKVNYVFEEKKSEIVIPDPTINPAQGAVDALDTVTLSYDGFYLNRQLVKGEFKEKITYTIDGVDAGEITAVLTGDKWVNADEYQTTVQLAVNAKKSGKYVITIPAGTFYIVDEAGDMGSKDLDELVLTYDVTIAVPNLPEPNIDPAPGKIASMSNVVLGWENVQFDLNELNVPSGGKVSDAIASKIKIYLNDSELTNWYSMMGAGLSVQNTKGSNEGSKGEDDAAQDWDVAVATISPGDMAFFWTGNVRIEVPEGLFVSVDGAKNGALTIEYIIGGVEIPEPTVNPEQGNVDALDNITISYDGFVLMRQIDIRENPMYPVTYTIDGENAGEIEATYLGQESRVYPGYYPQINLAVNATKSGKYVITIPTGTFFIIDEAGNMGTTELDELVLTYDVTIAAPALTLSPGLNDNDNTTQSGTIDNDKNTIKMVSQKDWVIVYVEHPEGTTVRYKRTNVQAHTATTQKVSLHAELADDADFQDAVEYQGKTAITLDTGTKGDLTIHYVGADGKPTGEQVYSFEVAKDVPTGIDGIAADEEGVEYYTLDGVKVKNPERGIYIRVANGQATKVVK